MKVPKFRHLPRLPNRPSFITAGRLAIVAAILLIVFVGIRIAKQETEMPQELPLKNKVQLLIASDYQQAHTTIPTIGKVEAQASAALKSEIGAQVISLNVKIGDVVQAGDVLLELDHSIFDAQLEQATAAISRADAALGQRIAGASSQEIAQADAAIAQAEAALNRAHTQVELTKLLARTAISNAESTLRSAQNNLQLSGQDSVSAITQNAYDSFRNTLNAALTTLSNALRSADNVLGIDNPLGNNDVDRALGTLDPSVLQNAQQSYDVAKAENHKARTRVLSLSPTTSQTKIHEAAEQVMAALDAMQKNLFDVDATLQKTQPIFELTPVRLEALRTGVAGSLAAVQASASALTAGQQAIETAKTNLTALQIAEQKALFDLEQAEEKAAEDIASAEAAVVVQQRAVDQARAARNVIVAPPRATDLATLRANVREAEAAYNIIAENKNKAFITSPIDGIVAAVDVKLSDLVSPGQPLISVVDINGMHVTAHLSFRDRQHVAPGADVLIQKSIPGIVTRIAPSINPTTNKVEFEIAIPETPQGLTVGQFIEADVTMNTNVEDSTKYFLPLAAVKVTSRAAYIYTVDLENRIRQQEVQLGRLIGDTVEVLGGITPEMLLVASVRGLEVGEEVEIL
ncbi:hypothetical protein COV82_02705 [Candidatus Peregrinibacteria bacterium CG11_big_fil_rev_8_21_14_0_20_46_8]|nr:MAG: hypothetical protein COV82_02705 [Candidatus Peregrinibacteria bacterium CG11_big_fil_rev_8_21_14_0_20_46_8]